METLALIIPTYNDSDRILGVISKWHDLFTKLNITFEIHVYNDGSSDNSYELLNNFCLNFKNIFLHSHPNIGHGPTILKGYIENCNNTWIFQADSDHEIGCEYFQIFWENRNNFDFIAGKRINTNKSFFRTILSLFARIITHIVFGLTISDVNVPYRLMRAKSFESAFKLIPENYFSPNIILSGYCPLKKLRWLEIEVKNVTGATKSSISFLKVLNHIFSLFYGIFVFRFKFFLYELKVMKLEKLFLPN